MHVLNPPRFTDDVLTINQSQTIIFGELCLCLDRPRRDSPEWQVGYSYGSATAGSNWLSYGENNQQRLVVEQKNPALELRLRLADRPIVSRPQEKLALSPSARTTLYLHTTLWLCLYYQRALLLELPAKKLSDIWFGPNSREGQLAYTDTTPTSLLWDADHYEDFKAVTTITIKNNSGEKLSLEKISIPVPELKLFRIGNRYQSDAIEITIDKDKDANLIIKPGHSDGKKAVLLNEARKSVTRSALTRAVNALFA